MSNWQQEGGPTEQEQVREDVPDPEDERQEMDVPPATEHGPQEDYPNPTQAAIDEEGASDRPVDVGGWEEGEAT
jgi:hypothetical protein